MSPPDTDQLASWLAQRLPAVRTLDLNPETIRVRYVLNWGGFVNHSFSIDDGHRRYHLKITRDADNITKLQRWRDMHDLLEARYHAPRLIDWPDLSDIGFTGLLFEHVDGQPADFFRNPALLQQVIGVVHSLHRDREIAARLSQRRTKTFLHHFVATYIERFTADLEIVGPAKLAFVSSALLEWMWDETHQLQKTAESLEGFQDSAIYPVHGDMHEGNLLVTPDDWFITDWDDLTLGDPALDFAILLWPMISRGRDWREFLRLDLDSGLAERIELCLRAQLLDEVIDSLADYVDAGIAGSRQAEVRFVKRSQHESALERYRAMTNKQGL